MLNIGTTVRATVTKVVRTAAFCQCGPHVVVVEAVEISERPIAHLGDYLLEGTSMDVLVLDFDPVRGRYVGSHRKSGSPNVVDRERPIPTVGGFTRLKQVALESARSLTADGGSE